MPEESIGDYNHERTRPKHDPVSGPLAIALIGLLCFAGGSIASWLILRAAGQNSSSKPLEDKVDNLSSSIDGRLDNLSRAVFDIRAGLSKPAATPGGPPHAGPSPIEHVVSVAELLRQAEKQRADKNFRGAEILLTRAVQTNRDDVSAWQALAAVHREMSSSSIKRGELLLAAQQADRARVSVNGIKGLSVDPASPGVDPRIVHDEEDATDKTVNAVRDAIDAACEEPIAAARRCAGDAWHWYWYNNREKTVEGLKRLREVIELGPWASEQTRISANESFSALKHLVNSDEWNDLLARAGFDPNSRETLKKWGLE
jgi:hypothetical protein